MIVQFLSSSGDIRAKEPVGQRTLDNWMLKHVAQGNCKAFTEPGGQIESSLVVREFAAVPFRLPRWTI